MIGDKLTQKDITEWCRSHKCTDEDCKYMINGGCYIMDYTFDSCQYCIDGICKRCRHYK